MNDNTVPFLFCLVVFGIGWLSGYQHAEGCVDYKFNYTYADQTLDDYIHFRNLPDALQRFAYENITLRKIRIFYDDVAPVKPIALTELRKICMKSGGYYE